MKSLKPARLVFITGTDTGVGKTLLTALLLSHLRRRGCHALAMKPFCSGGTADVELLHDVQEGELQPEEINPFYFAEPLAPLVAGRLHRQNVSLTSVVKAIDAVRTRCEWLLIEGSGGLLVPLGEGASDSKGKNRKGVYDVADLIRVLDCDVIVAARNRLGTINHTLLTMQAIESRALADGLPRSCKSRSPGSHKKMVTDGMHGGSEKEGRSIGVVLMNHQRQDSSGVSNAAILREMLPGRSIVSVPFLKGNLHDAKVVKQNAKKNQKTLANILG